MIISTFIIFNQHYPAQGPPDSSKMEITTIVGVGLVIMMVVGIVIGIQASEENYELKTIGIKVPGHIIYNEERGGADQSRRNDSPQPGGNINHPTVHFITKDGREIIGKPALEYISNREIKEVMNIMVMYDPKNPYRFIIV